MISSHASPFAGTWYPARRDELERLLESLFAASLPRTGPSLWPRPLAFVVPHAGLAYSGPVAAAAYRHLQEARPARVFILGFAHRGGAPGVAIPSVDAFETPLGRVPVDRAAVEQLTAGGDIRVVDEAEVCDHSVEIQLPLLQKAAPGAAVVPLYVGAMIEARRAAAAQRLAAALRPSDILLASSDFTHYGRSFGYVPFPVGPDVALRLSQLDESAIEAAGSLDATLFLDTMRELDATVCGQAPIALLLETLALLGGEEIYQHTLDYQTSGEITGDFHHSVSYAALGYFRADSFELGASAQAALLASARATLQTFNATGERRPALPPEPLADELTRRSAVFVSLHERGELFGCIGTRSMDAPLAETVPELALSAALDDPRFPVRVNIPDELEIEISVLTPFKRIRDWRAFRIGRDGAYLQHESRAALLLPQVAEHGYDATGFLEALSNKAGLRRAAYRDASARLFVFRAQVFSGRGA